ncbi:MAG: 1-(5-phosphoribosyl)-5-[(5-phosphoribosylamino)methylideneamino]imidazole-4-carboxamide isomerase [Vallitaleaceae bacterium]|nr:1-(5-phosphoribosyl)-5-[(5-phosphoribosylamino)methylideneamino]imidazole-4-carboxamide isomerase [Vallitaleaceae bacterium]
MQLYPAIDIKNGKCVRLFQGRFDQETIFAQDPSEIAKKWENLGATYIHVVDLDGALDGKWVNQEAISKIVRSVSIPVQTGGGVRSLKDIEDRLTVGIDRVIIGTMAVANPNFVKEAVERFGSKHIAVGIDAKDGMVATHGWEQVSSVEAVDFALQMKSLGVEVIIYTDISKDGTMEGPNLEQTKNLVEKSGMYIIASGGVSKIEDLEDTKRIGAKGTIIGKALYLEAIDLKEAVLRFERGE